MANYAKLSDEAMRSLLPVSNLSGELKEALRVMSRRSINKKAITASAGKLYHEILRRVPNAQRREIIRAVTGAVSALAASGEIAGHSDRTHPKIYVARSAARLNWFFEQR